MVRQLKLDLPYYINRLLNHPSLAVQRELAIALRHLKSSEAARMWAWIAERHHDGTDRWYLEALGIGAEHNWDASIDAFVQHIREPSWKWKERRDIIWRSRAAKTPEFLAKIVADEKTPADELPKMFRAFDFQKDSDLKNAALVKLAFGDIGDPERQRFITSEALARIKKLDLKSNPQHAEALNKLLDRSRGTGTFVEMVSKFSVAERYPELLAIAQKQPGEQLGIDAMRLLLERDAKIAQPGLVNNDVKVALATVEAIGNAANPNANPLLLPIVIDTKADLELRRQATRALARTKSGALQLVKLAKEKKLDEQLKFAAASGISALPGDDVRSQAFGLLPFPTTKAELPIAPINMLVKQKGNANNGKQIFAKQGTCANCHVVNGEGKEVGPNLSEIGKKLSKEALYESILYPSAGISHNYETHILETKRGDVVQGILISKTPAEVTLKDKDAILRTFKTSEIESLTQSPISLMPADLHKNMTTQELADVVEYLLTLREARKK
jgi:putative heme-binding domain-containing protein